jgi:hypothetical protein
VAGRGGGKAAGAVLCAVMQLQCSNRATAPRCRHIQRLSTSGCPGFTQCVSYSVLRINSSLGDLAVSQEEVALWRAGTAWESLHACSWH